MTPASPAATPVRPAALLVRRFPQSPVHNRGKHCVPLSLCRASSVAEALVGQLSTKHPQEEDDLPHRYIRWICDGLPVINVVHTTYYTNYSSNKEVHSNSPSPVQA
jgi:hypothetical protein